MTLRRFIGFAAAIMAVAWSTTATPAQETGERIAVIGTGEVGSTLGKIWAEAGHDIIYGSRTPDEERIADLVADTGHGARADTPERAAAQSDMVLLAVPWKAMEQVVAGLGDLSGKVIIDPINYFQAENGYPAPLEGPSVAQQIQALAPQATVVKAFNTLGMVILQDRSLAGGPVTVPLAGDSREAKARVARLVEDAGLEPMDMGPLLAATYIEGMLELYIGYRLYNDGKAFEFYLRPTGE